MREAVILAAARTPVGRAKTGSLRDTRPEDLLAAVLAEVCNRTPGLNKKDVDDVVVGCAGPAGARGANLARTTALYAGMPDSVPGHTVSRACSSGLQAIAIGAQSIMCGFADAVIAGGVGSMSCMPMSGAHQSAHAGIVDNCPEVYTPMGLAAENIATQFNVDRRDMDRFAVGSHRKALEAIEKGRFRDEIVPVKARVYPLDPNDRSGPEEILFDTDECPGASLEELATLEPAFDPAGSVTARNSSPPGDGAAALLVASREMAQKLDIKPMAAFRCCAVAGAPPEISGIGPAIAVPKLLTISGMKIEDFGLVELDEASACQAVYCIRELGLNEEIVNVNGGTIALGHPVGGTGAVLAVTILYEMARRKVRYGLVAMSAEGGMGLATAFELEDQEGSRE
jgi:acetyl-CoA acyltransferase